MDLLSFVSICLSYNLDKCIQRVSTIEKSYVLVPLSLINDVSSQTSVLNEVQVLTLTFP